MRWLDQWRALAGRIEGLVRAAEVFGQFSNGGVNDAVSVIGRALLPEAQSIDKEIQLFAESFKSSLPPSALAAVQTYLRQQWSNAVNQGQVTGVAPLIILRSSFEYAIRDIELAATSRVELAFEHLRRLLAVDAQVRQQWLKAFDANEPQCEKLGAVHLLAHGIWAFKVNGGGAATDLVMNEPLQAEMELVERTGNAIVLTEWKLVRERDDFETKAEEARRQAQLYAAGVLGGLELKQTRYVVLVAKSKSASLGHQELHGVRYRHVVIEIDPDSPSKAARAKS